MKQVELYTDGSCLCNPGVGGWCAILSYNGHEKVVSGAVKETTNNRMELFAVIQGLRALKEPCRVSLHSDSAYVINAFELRWINDWQAKGWKKSNRAIANVDLWQLLIIEVNKHKVDFIKVRAHADNEKNNRCDIIARGEAQSLSDRSGVT